MYFASVHLVLVQVIDETGALVQFLVLLVFDDLVRSSWFLDRFGVCRWVKGKRISIDERDLDSE